MTNKLLVAAALTLASGMATASAIVFQTSLGPEASGATGSGMATLVYDTVTHDLDITADWTGLSGTTTVAHLHCCLAVPGVGTVGHLVNATVPLLEKGWIGILVLANGPDAHQLLLTAVK